MRLANNQEREAIAVWKAPVLRRRRLAEHHTGGAVGGGSSGALNRVRRKGVSPGLGERGKRRQFQHGSCEGATKIIIGIGVAARKAGTSQSEDRFHLGGGRATAEQLLGDPLIGNTPIGWRETLRDSQAVHPLLIDLAGRGWCEREMERLPARRATGIRSDDAVGGNGGQRQLELGRLNQRGAIGCQASLGVQKFDPGRVAIGLTSCRLLIGEPGQPSQVTPVGASQVAVIGAGQLFADRGSHRRIERSWTDVNPGLAVAGTGLENDTGLMSAGAHGGDDARVGVIEIDENVAGITPLGVTMPPCESWAPVQRRSPGADLLVTG